MNRQPLSATQIASVINGLNSWAWELPTKLFNGVNITTAPASESSEHRNGIMRCVQVNSQATGLPRLSYIISLRAGWSETGAAPAELIAAVSGNQEQYLALKNRYQISVSFNPEIPQQAAILAHFWPTYHTAKAGDTMVVPSSTLKIIGLRFAASRTTVGGLAQTQKGGFIFNYSDIEIVSPAELFEDGASFKRAGTTIDHAAAFAQLGIGGQAMVTPVMPNAGSPNVAVPQSRAAVPAGAAGQPDPTVVAALTAAGDFNGLSKYLASF